MMEIMLSHDYLGELAIHYPDLLGGKLFETVLCDRRAVRYGKIVRLVRVLYKALHDIRFSLFNGDLASIVCKCLSTRSFHFFWLGRKKIIFAMYYRDNL
ncbi:MAG: hypothetical protein V8R07_08045 [Bacteroides fragilis]